MGTREKIGEKIRKKIKEKIGGVWGERGAKEDSEGVEKCGERVGANGEVGGKEEIWSESSTSWTSLAKV